MHEATPERNEGAEEPTSSRPAPGLLSQSDPEPEQETGRAPIWLVVGIVAVVVVFVVLHLTGAVGPGSH